MRWKYTMNRCLERSTKFFVVNHRVVSKVPTAGVCAGADAFYIWLSRKKPEIMDVETMLDLGDEPRNEKKMMAEPEDEELDELVCIATYDQKIDQLGRKSKSIVAPITTAMENCPNHPKIAELKVKLWKTMTTI
ncbi:hypothetical protein ACET3Z_027925 [Daucus carota]